MWTLAGGNLSEDEFDDGDDFQDFDGDDDGVIVPPTAQSESSDQCLEMLRRIQDMENEDNEVKHSDPPQEDAVPGSEDLQTLFEIPEDAVQSDSSKTMFERLGGCRTLSEFFHIVSGGVAHPDIEPLWGPKWQLLCNLRVPADKAWSKNHRGSRVRSDNLSWYQIAEHECSVAWMLSMHKTLQSSHFVSFIKFQDFISFTYITYFICDSIIIL